MIIKTLLALLGWNEVLRFINVTEGLLNTWLMQH